MAKTEQRRRWFLPAGVVALLLLCTAWGFSQWQLATFEQELENIAESKIDTLRPPAKGLWAGRIGAQTVVSRPYLLFGPTEGKISVYIEQKNVKTGPKIQGIDFFFEREPDATWTELESARCTSRECQITGARVLDTTGKAL